MVGYSPSAARLRSFLFKHFYKRDDISVAPRIGAYIKDVDCKVVAYPNWLTDYAGKTDVELAIYRNHSNEWLGPWRWEMQFPTSLFWNETLYKEAQDGNEHLFLQIRNAELAEGLRRYIMDKLQEQPEGMNESDNKSDNVFYSWNSWYCFRKNHLNRAYLVDYDQYTEDNFKQNLNLRELVFWPNRRYYSDRSIADSFEEINNFLKRIGCPEFLASGYNKINSNGLGSVCDLSPLLEKKTPRAPRPRKNPAAAK